MQQNAMNGSRRRIMAANDYVRQRRTLVLATVLATLVRIGAYWDVQWHWAVGRDSFFIPPHTLIYVGVALIGIVSLLMAWQSSPRRRRKASPMFWGWLIQLFGVVLIVSAAPFDDLWHRRFGIDVTIWSPPHMLGVAGGWIVDLGLFIGWATEWQQGVERRRARAALLGLSWATLLLVSMLNFGLIPAMRWSVLQPVTPVLYSALGSLLIPGVFIALCWITGRLWPTLVVLLGLVVLRLLDQQVWDYGLQYVVPLWGESVRRTDLSRLYWHFWLHPIFNTATALTVMALGWSWRVRRRIWGAILTGALTGLMILGMVSALASGMVVPVEPFTGQGQAATDFHTDSDYVLSILGTGFDEALNWAVFLGAISGVLGYMLVRIVRRIGRASMSGVDDGIATSYTRSKSRNGKVRMQTVPAQNSTPKTQHSSTSHVD